MGGRYVIFPFVYPTSSGANLHTVQACMGSTMILDSNPQRKGCIVFNTSLATMFLKFGEGASENSMTVKIRPNSVYEMSSPAYVGRMDAVWDGDGGMAYVTELT